MQNRLHLDSFSLLVIVHCFTVVRYLTVSYWTYRMLKQTRSRETVLSSPF